MKILIKYGFIAFVMLSLYGCSGDIINDYDIKWANDTCKERGGLRYIKTAGINKWGCKCQNGDFEYSN